MGIIMLTLPSYRQLGVVSMWVVKIMENFEVESAPGSLRLPFPISIDTGKMIGFLPVYETLEDAKTEYPDSDYMEIRKKNERDVSA